MALLPWAHFEYKLFAVSFDECLNRSSELNEAKKLNLMRAYEDF
jgi:cobalamin biosynthesis protein CobT